MAKVELTYKCEDCGKDFVSHRTRKGVLLCADCIGKRRKEGKGPIQVANGGKAPAEPQAKVSVAEPVVAKAAPVAVPIPAEGEKAAGPSSLADLATKLREKHARGKASEAPK